MKQCAPPLLEKYLHDYGWSFNRAGAGVWYSGFRTERRSYPVRLVLDSSFLSLVVQPLVKMELDLEAFPEVAGYLLELNFQSYMARLGVDEIGDVVLSIDLINGAFGFDEFMTAMGVLGHYADHMYNEITQYLAQNFDYLPPSF